MIFAHEVVPLTMHEKLRRIVSCVIELIEVAVPVLQRIPHQLHIGMIYYALVSEHRGAEIGP